MENINYEKDNNITVSSDNQLFNISYYKDKDYFMNMDNYVKFIKACEHTIRKHPDYDNVITSIREDHMEHCQVLGNISRYDATLEIHHGPMLTLFDYCAIIINYLLAKNKKDITTFKVSKIIIDEHLEGNIQVVVLSKTVHQLIDTGEIFINLDQGIGNIEKFLDRYHEGLDDGYIDKINKYIDLSKKFQSTDNNILSLENKMIQWSYRDNNKLKNLQDIES